MERGPESTVIIARDEFHAELVKWVSDRIEAEALVVGAHGEIEERMVARAIERRQRAAREQAVHHLDAEIKIVEEGAVPIPNHVANARAGHVVKRLWTAARGPRNLRLMSVAPTPKVRRWKCVCAYDGSAFIGWQSQDDRKGVQDVIEARMKDIFGELVRVHASGRTDAGVHARAQVFHFDAAWRHGAEKLLAALRSCIPPELQIISLRPVSEKFHARFSATGKRYVYHVHLGDADPFTRPYCWPVFRPIDVAAMRAAAAVLVGKHDFRAFVALNGPAKEDTVRDLRRLDVVKRGRRITITAEANGFLYKMVRSLAGTLVGVGEGKITPADVASILASKKRSTPVLTAPAQGLFLEKVFYR